VISPFLHNRQFALVTDARFTPGPGGNVRRGKFSFDKCWTGLGWSELIGLAMLFPNRKEAVAYFEKHRATLESALAGETDLAKDGA
jgi:hypothetical protein